MKLTVPSFYFDFHCIASRCTDSCCIGWEIDIDPSTAAYYRQRAQKNDSFAARLKQNIDFSQTPHFLLTPQERCPFLNEQNLCDLILHLGEEHLCEICDQHPRFHEWFGSYKESGLGLCCEEAVRLLISDASPLHFVHTEIEEAPDDAPFDPQLLQLLLLLRERFFAVLHDRAKPLSQRFCTLLCLADQAQEAIDFGDIEALEQLTKDSCVPLPEPSKEQPYKVLDAILSFSQTLEPIDPLWPQRLQTLQNQLPKLLSKKYSPSRPHEYEHLCVYLLYRYLLKAARDGELLSRIKAAVLFSLLVLVLEMETAADFSPSQQIINIKALSKELEYSDENWDALLEQSWNHPAFSCQNLCSLSISLL